jgi:hypothetical protein
LLHFAHAQIPLSLIGVRGKPRRSGRGRIARTANSRPLVGF